MRCRSPRRSSARPGRTRGHRTEPARLAIAPRCRSAGRHGLRGCSRAPGERHAHAARFEQAPGAVLQALQQRGFRGGGNPARQFVEVVERDAMDCLRLAVGWSGATRDAVACICAMRAPSAAHSCGVTAAACSKWPSPGRIELHHAQGVLERRSAAVPVPTCGAAGVPAMGTTSRYRPGALRRLSRSFFAAIFGPSRGGRIVDETQPQRLLDLVGKPAGEEHPGNVGFDAADGFVDGVQGGVGRRIEHSGNEGGLRCRRDGHWRGLRCVHARLGSRRPLRAVYSCRPCAVSLRSILMAG